MRLYEFASAQAQLALWKLISDNVWSAIDQQARDESKRRAATKSTSRPKRGSSIRKTSSTPMARPSPNPLRSQTLQSSPQSIVGGQSSFVGNTGQPYDPLNTSTKTVPPENDSTISNTTVRSVDKDTDDRSQLSKSKPLPMTSQFGRLPVAQKR